MTKRPAPVSAPLRVVGIGASAGGLDAMKKLFAATPPDTGMAFVVLQHLAASQIGLHPRCPLLIDEDAGARHLLGYPDRA